MISVTTGSSHNIPLHSSSSILSLVRYYRSEIGVLDGGVLAQHVGLVHLHHSLRLHIFTDIIFSQDAAPLMLSRMGEDSLNGTPFFSYLITLMHLRYMYSLAFSLTNVSCIKISLRCEYKEERTALDCLLFRQLPEGKAGNGSRQAPIPHGFRRVIACTEFGLFS